MDGTPTRTLNRLAGRALAGIIASQADLACRSTSRRTPLRGSPPTIPLRLARPHSYRCIGPPDRTAWRLSRRAAGFQPISGFSLKANSAPTRLPVVIVACSA